MVAGVESSDASLALDAEGVRPHLSYYDRTAGDLDVCAVDRGGHRRALPPRPPNAGESAAGETGDRGAAASSATGCAAMNLGDTGDGGRRR